MHENDKLSVKSFADFMLEQELAKTMYNRTGEGMG